MNYHDMLKILAEKKLAQQNSDQNFKNSQPQEEHEEEDNGLQEYEIPFPEGDMDEESMIAKNDISQERLPLANTEIRGANKEDVQLIQGLGILDKIQMKRQGLDPWNSEDVKKYKISADSV